MPEGEQEGSVGCSINRKDGDKVGDALGWRENVNLNGS
jgi:hypothetical protein